MASRILVDSGFWFALWDVKDGDKQSPDRHRLALRTSEKLGFNEFLLPWPTFYEILCTRFMRRRKLAEQFLTQLERPNFFKLDDTKYREAALADTRFALTQRRELSLVDAILRQMLQDKTLMLQGIITFNVKDFGDICYPLGLQIYPYPADYRLASKPR
jgi:predicted nucleic acid-binding protein